MREQLGQNEQRRLSTQGREASEQDVPKDDKKV